MASPKVTINRAGTCPHGMPLGGCPVCNGMGGGGAKKADFSAKKGELSWNECYAIGQMIKAQKSNAEADKQANTAALAQASFLAKLANTLAQRIATIQNFINNNILNSKPVIILKNTVATIGKAIAKPIMATANMIKKTITQIAKTFNQIKTQFINITDKLAAIFGEQKQALEKFASENIEKMKKGLMALFGPIEKTQNEESNAEEIEKREKEHSKMQRIKEKIKRLFKQVEDKE